MTRREELHAKRAKLVAELAKVDAEIARLPALKGRGKPMRGALVIFGDGRDAALGPKETALLVKGTPWYLEQLRGQGWAKYVLPDGSEHAL